jgi:hypothetical protein
MKNEKMKNEELNVENPLGDFLIYGASHLEGF